MLMGLRMGMQWSVVQDGYERCKDMPQGIFINFLDLNFLKAYGIGSVNFCSL